MTSFLLLLLCLCGIGQTLAGIRYVTDVAQIMMRGGESTRHRILRILTSGTAMQELRKNERTGYSRVRLKDGTVGYVLARQLQDEPGARAMEARLAELQQEPDQLVVKLTDLQSAHEQLEKDHEELAKEKGKVEKELADLKSANANLVAVTLERSKLRMRVIKLTRKINDKEQENRDLMNKTNQRWFLIGAGVVIGSIPPRSHLAQPTFSPAQERWRLGVTLGHLSRVCCGQDARAPITRAVSNRSDPLRISA